MSNKGSITVKDLAYEVANRSEVSIAEGKRRVQNVFDALFELITAAKSTPDRVYINGFGTFKFKKRDGRTIHSNLTGGVVKVAPKVVMTFKASPGLQEDLNKKL